MCRPHFESKAKITTSEWAWARDFMPDLADALREVAPCKTVYKNKILLRPLSAMQRGFV
jgi:hypothetical protein